MGRLVKVSVKGIQMSVGPSVLLPQAFLRDQFQSIQPLEVLSVLTVAVELDGLLPLCLPLFPEFLMPS